MRNEQHLVKLAGLLSHTHLFMIYGGLKVAITGSRSMNSYMAKQSPATSSLRKREGIASQRPQGVFQSRSLICYGHGRREKLESCGVRDGDLMKVHTAWIWCG